jgi:FkbM family methyltransferase
MRVSTRSILRSSCLLALCGIVVITSACSHSSRRATAQAGKATEASAHRDILRTERKLYSLANEELIIRDFFQDRHDGFFLDVGCARPIRESNTYYLEKHLGWSGIGVDALPEFAQPWLRKRPKSRFFNFLVSDHSDVLQPFFRAELRGISSAVKPSNDPGGKPAKSEEIQVPTITLTALLERAGVAKVDFLSMDIEGFEPQALAGFDIERFKPELACVEAKPLGRNAINKYFADHGYERVNAYRKYDEVNYYYSPKSVVARAAP